MGYAVTLDQGIIHVAGGTISTWYMSTPGAHQVEHGGGGLDGFIARFDVNGQWVWGTYYGGYDTDEVLGICAVGDVVYATGYSSSVYVMGMPSCHQPFFAGGQCDAFVARFGPGGQREWGTFCGGYLGDQGTAVRVLDGDVHIAGYTASTSLISTPGAHQASAGGIVDMLLARFSGGPVGVGNDRVPGPTALHAAPLPATDHVVLRWDDEGPAPSTWTLFSSSGSAVMHGMAPDHGPWKVRIDLTGVPSGTHVLQVLRADGPLPGRTGSVVITVVR
jgi:hypothetical protein